MNRITIFHYHLLPGGVTNVILLGAAALIKNYPDLQLLRLVSGSKENTDIIRKRIEKEADAVGLIGDSFQFEICIEPDLQYSDLPGTITDSEIKSLSEKLLRKFGDSFWWIHNYQLGKNPLFTAAVMNISETAPRQKMLLHIHDFPECARFDNLQKLYSAGVKNPYPAGAGTAYGLINSRDARILNKAGIPDDRIFLINNPVEDDSTTHFSLAEEQAAGLTARYYAHYKDEFPRINPEGKMLFYPVRTIRRKNALEAGLIAAVSEKPVNLVLSLPGVSAQEKAYSDTCEKCFRDGLIPGIWGSGADSSPAVPTYPQMLQLCDMIISTSVQEGFGYLFINSVQLGIQLAARYLDILDGIKNVFPPENSCFYSTFKIPVSNSDIKHISAEYIKKLSGLEKYISSETVDRIRNDISTLTSEGLIDFSYLPVEKQVETLSLVDKSSEFKKEVHTLNEKLMNRIYKQLDSGRYKASINTDSFSLKTHSNTIESIINMLYNDEKTNYKKEDVQQNLLNHFAEPDYMRLLYDY